MTADTTDIAEATSEEASEAELPAVPAGSVAALSTLSTALGESLLESHIKPNGDLWVRVATEAWRKAGEVAKDELECVWFDFLSVIDWLPSPFGRDMDAEQDRIVHGAPARELETMEHGYAGGESRLQVFARVSALPSGSIGRHGGPRSGVPELVGQVSSGQAGFSQDGAGETVELAHIAPAVILKADLPDQNPAVESWIPVYAGADWHEREAWEMFGVVFIGHPDLRHIYLPSEFEGNPMRKDFPLLARRVKPWPGIVDVELMPGEDDEAAEEDEG